MTVPLLMTHTNNSHTASVFLAESCQPTDASLSRRFISDELGITDTYAVRGTQQQPQPLLYGIVSKLQEWKHERETDAAYTASDGDTNGENTYVYAMFKMSHWTCQ
jgi:hypothetical protein